MRNSVIAKDTQYFIAEATKTLDLVDNQHCDVEGDALWVGCASVDKSGRLCEVRNRLRVVIPPNHCISMCSADNIRKPLSSQRAPIHIPASP